jgi:hypothetical protein
MQIQTVTVRIPARIVIVAEPAGEPMAVDSIMKVGMPGVQTAGRCQTCANMATAHMRACHARPRSSHVGTSEMESSNAASPDVRATKVSTPDVTAAHVHSATAAEMHTAAATKMGSTSAKMGSAAATKMSAATTAMAAAAAPSECIRCN